MTTALEGGEGSASRPGRSLPLGKTQYPLYRRLGGPQGRSGQVRKILTLPGFNPRTVQPIASRYTDWATRPTCKCMSVHKRKLTKSCLPRTQKSQTKWDVLGTSLASQKQPLTLRTEWLRPYCDCTNKLQATTVLTLWICTYTVLIHNTRIFLTFMDPCIVIIFLYVYIYIYIYIYFF